jgi:hypothetical protein
MDQQASGTQSPDAPSRASTGNSDTMKESDWQKFHLKDDPRWQLAQRIAASQSFSRSSLLSKFLLYVCDRALTGRTDEIGEHKIGVHVFGRRPTYNPSEDNIVRNYARQLRQRLDHYFEEEGKSEELRLSIPLGKYVPVFSTIQIPEIISEETAIEPQLPLATQQFGRPQIAAPSSEKRRRRLPLFAAALIVVLLAGAFAWLTIRRTARTPSDPLHPLWAQLFNQSHQTFLVPADDGIVMFQNLTGHSVHLAEYINRDYLTLNLPHQTDAANMADLDKQRYTSVTDLDSVLRFSRLPEAAPDRFIVRYARELQMDDLKDGNAILLGSSFSNPWVELFQKSLNFDFEYQPHPNDSIIINKHPISGELPIYANDAAAPSHQTYAVIALLPNLNNSGWVLIVEGLTMAGTQAAEDTLFDRQAMQPILSKAATANGALKPFEILIETRSFGSSSPQAKIIASRIYPPASI